MTETREQRLEAALRMVDKCLDHVLEHEQGVRISSVRELIEAALALAPGEAVDLHGDGCQCARANCTMRRMPVIDDPVISEAMASLEDWERPDYTLQTAPAGGAGGAGGSGADGNVGTNGGNTGYCVVCERYGQHKADCRLANGLAAEKAGTQCSPGSHCFLTIDRQKGVLVKILDIACDPEDGTHGPLAQFTRIAELAQNEVGVGEAKL